MTIDLEEDLANYYLTLLNSWDPIHSSDSCNYWYISRSLARDYYVYSGPRCSDCGSVERSRFRSELYNRLKGEIGFIEAFENEKVDEIDMQQLDYYADMMYKIGCAVYGRETS